MGRIWLSCLAVAALTQPHPTSGEPGGGSGPSEDRFAFFIEPALALGGISHDFPEDDIDQFGYDVKGGCEQDAAYLRLGLGRHFGRCAAFAYGEIGSIAPGVLMDNHGPYILPEVLLSMSELSYGFELDYAPARARLGFGSYGGTAEIDEDTVGSGPTGSWETDIVDGHGFHYAAGVFGRISRRVVLGLEWSQHFVSLRLDESGTGADPSVHEATVSQVRFTGLYELPFDL